MKRGGRADQAARSLSRTTGLGRSVPPTISAMIGCMPREWKPPTDEQRCTATVNNGPRKGQRCPKYHIKGATVCLAHGGKAPQVRAAAARRVANQKAVELASRVDIELPVFTSAADVGRYLLGEVHKRTQQFGILADRLDSATYADKAGREHVRAVLAEQRRWLDSMGKVLAVAVAARPAGEASGPDPAQVFRLACGLFRQDVDAALADVGLFDADQREAIMARLAARADLRLRQSAGLIAEQIKIMAEAAT